jgi:sugar phosphate isomerase/epimerase
MKRVLGIVVVLACVAWLVSDRAVAGPEDGRGAGASVLAKDNLVAWCVVPFDAAQRGPRERAAMLRQLGLRKLAYDWRAVHVPTFEEEIVALKEQGIEMFAFWGEHEAMFRLFEKYKITPQVWRTVPSPSQGTQKEKIEAAARQLLPLAKRTQALGCKLGLYNHGGWGGEPENLAAVCRWLREHAGAEHVGIVYNLHHGHGHIDDFADCLALMQPYLLCLNLNGMNDGAQPKILPLGQGRHEKAMLRTLVESGYRGPIGILDHRGDVDAEKSLRENLEGLETLLGQLGEKAALETYR